MRQWLSMLALLFCCKLANATLLPLPELPAEWRASTIADQLYSAGREARIIQFSTPDSQALTLQHFQQTLGSPPSVSSQNYHRWTSADYHYDIIFQQAGETEPQQGLLLVSTVSNEKSPEWFAEDISLPQGSVVLADIHANDQGKHSRTLHLQHPHGAAESYREITEALQRRGWEILSTPNTDSAAFSMELHNNNKHLFGTFVQAAAQTDILLIYTKT